MRVFSFLLVVLTAVSRQAQDPPDNEAAGIRAKAQMEAAKIRSDAQSDARKIVAEARANAARILAEAEAERDRLRNEAFVKDPELFVLIKKIELMREVLGGKTLVLITKDSPILELLFDAPRKDAPNKDAPKKKEPEAKSSEASRTAIWQEELGKAISLAASQGRVQVLDGASSGDRLILMPLKGPGPR